MGSGLGQARIFRFSPKKTVVFQMHKKWHPMGALQISQDMNIMNEHSVQTLAFAVFSLDRKM